MTVATYVVQENTVPGMTGLLSDMTVQTSFSQAIWKKGPSEMHFHFSILTDAKHYISQGKSLN